MRKIVLGFICLVILIGVMLLGLFIYSNSQCISSSALIKKDGGKIIYKTEKDLDRDRVPEKIILYETKKGDDDWGVYSRALISKTISGKEKVLFRFDESKFEYFEGIPFDNSKELVRINDSNKNGIPEVYLLEEGPNTQSLMIIESVKGKYTVVYYGKIFNYGYSDVDRDGKLEFFGITDNFVGARHKHKTIFKINRNGLYVPFKEMSVDMSNENK
jgi:hypothetical protein